MSIKSIKYIVNEVRRAVMHGLTRYVDFSDVKIEASAAGLNVKRILLCRPNSRLGNQLMITPLVRECINLFPGCKIDLFVRGSLSEIIFKNYKQVDRIIELPRKPFSELRRYIKVWLSLRRQAYDLAINVAEGSVSGQLSTRFARARGRCFNNVDGSLQARYPGYGHMARRPVYNLRHYLLQSGVAVADRPVPPLSLKLSAAELAEGQRVLDYFVCPARETICIYTYATGIKCYSREWWAAMYSQLKEAFGETYNILEVLPIENVSQINFEATAYYSDDIREIAAVMAHAALFVGADSGMMHLAAASGTPTVGLFSVTDPAVYRPYSGCNLAIDTNTTGAGGIIAALHTILNYNRYLAPCNN